MRLCFRAEPLLLPRDFLLGRKMAERVGFEPTIPVKVCPLSRRIVSTAHAPLRKAVASRRLPVNETFRRTTSGQRLSTFLKERLQQFCAAACEHSAANFYFVVQLRMIQQLHDGPHCARSWIV